MNKSLQYFLVSILATMANLAIAAQGKWIEGYGKIKPEAMVTGTLISREVGGSGGNPIGLKNCKLVK